MASIEEFGYRLAQYSEIYLASESFKILAKISITAIIVILFDRIYDENVEKE